MRLVSKVALVTGAGSGIGRACSIRLAEEGAAIVCTDIDLPAAQHTVELIAEAGGRAVALEHDAASEQRWQQVVDHAVDQMGRLDVLVNNAGIGVIANIEDETLEGWQRTMDVNLNGVFLGCREGIRAMKLTGGGSIINISSIEGIVGWGMVPAYNASKGGVRILTKSVALHCCEKGTGVRVNSVHPGFISTAMVESIGSQLPPQVAEATVAKILGNIPMGELGTAADVANGVLFLASDESRYMTGSELVIDGGYTAQ